ncbi:hypothetical protein DQK91_16280 [Oceanidesulfovibrio marinus]|uniref:Bacterial sugar transferase domain-containing protein n=2 Tax=Oceanidesulfovibrio marinus TaxID=370038 RepID=A0A6P1ZD24_9BACT|nr:hypothetical protein DQK91_16280 [Oceanidesulfovibrio marinus]
MSFGQRLRGLVLHGNKPKKGPVVSICSQEEFATFVQREYNRSARTGVPFFVIEFHLVDLDTYPEIAQDLLGVLARRLRTTDEVGWCGNDCIGALLIGAASMEAAVNVAEEILAAMTVEPKPVYTVHSAQDGRGSDDGAGCGPGKGAGGSAEGRGDARSGAGSGPGRDSGAMRSSEPVGLRDKAKPAPITELKLMSKRAMPLWKRTMDIVIASVALVLLSPLFLAVALLIKIVSPGPVFFKQERIGYAGRRFELYKFRTMHVNIDHDVHQKYVQQLIKSARSSDEDEDKPMVKLDLGKDPRVIPFGDFLRKASIDELPQLFNVLRKEMSIVGPRPPIPYEVSEYACWQTGRFDSFPGLTGLWQVSGKNSLSFRQMARLDIRYSRQMSFWLDCRIIFLTPAVILHQMFEKKQIGAQEGSGG